MPLTNSEDEYVAHLQKISQDNTYSQPEASLALPFDPQHTNACRDLYAKLVRDTKLKYVVVIGIGGSNLGTLAIYNALFGERDTHTHHAAPRLICLDTVHSATLHLTVNLILREVATPDELVVCVISKSGNTTETMANANIFIDTLSRRNISLKNRVVCITDAKSPFDHFAQEHNLHVLHLPKQVGGRYSVFSSVGLFPLLCTGVVIDLLLKGAQCALLGLENRTSSPAIATYRDLKEALSQGVHVHDLFLFDPRLETLGKWYRQLCAESLGKEGKGLLPTVSIGSTDLHSVAQLYLGGKNDRITSFLWVTQDHTYTVSKDPFLPLVPSIKGQSLSEIYRAIYEGTRVAYRKTGRRYHSFEWQKLGEYELGMWMQSAMVWTMLLGKHLDINAFDQPQVELYKEAMRSFFKS